MRLKVLVLLILAIIATPMVIYGMEQAQTFTIIYTSNVLAEIEPCG